MRKLEECRAEVFRRSGERIRARRRKRLHLLAACVPVCLCLVICAVAAAPFGRQQDQEKTQDGAVPTLAGSSYYGFTGTLQECFPEQVPPTERDPEEVFSIIQGLFGVTADSSKEAEHIIAFSAVWEQDQLLITLETEDGRTLLYTLEGDVLVDVQNQHTVTSSSTLEEDALAELQNQYKITLSPHQKTELLELLGLN